MVSDDASVNIKGMSLERLPQPGDVITIRRRHGGTSEHTVAEMRNRDRGGRPCNPVAILARDEHADAAMTAWEAQSALENEPVHYVKPDRVPEKPWGMPTAAHRPILWCWRSRAGQWVATGNRPLRQGEPPPSPGELITARRRDGSESRQRALNYYGATSDGFPQLTVSSA